MGEISRSHTLILASILITTLLVDMILSSFFDVLGQKLVSTWGLVLFIGNTMIIFGVGQYLLLGYVKRATQDLRTKKVGIKITYKIVEVVQYVVCGIIGLIILQIIFYSQYSTKLIIAATIVSYIPACAIMLLLSYRFYLWFRLGRNAITFLFLIGSFFVGINLGAGVILHNYYLWTIKPYNIVPQLQIKFPIMTPTSSGIVSIMYLYVFFIPLNLAYLFAWGGCVVLLRYYSKVLGRTKFFVVISIPMVIFLIANYPTFIAIPTGSFTFYDYNLIVFRVLYRLAGTGGGVFIFCVALLSIAKSIKKVQRTSIVSDYMTISAYGVAILAVTLQSPIIHTPYPPFGIASLSFVALASYLFSLGFYFSAISISQDIKLRHSIRKYVMKESQLIDSIATAQLEKETTDKVIQIAKENAVQMERETGVVTSLEDDDFRAYLQEIVTEFRNAKTTNRQNENNDDNTLQ